MKIKTEPNLRGRKLKAYKLGYERGYKAAPEADIAYARECISRLESRIRVLEASALRADRNLQFANDRIEQLTNSVVIIRDKK